jgi:hypothetical protein
MERIYTLLHHLSKPQIKILKVLLRYLPVRKDPDTRLLQLTDFLLNSNEVPSLEICSEAIYGKLNYQTFQKLKSRLQSKIFSTLLLDPAFENKESNKDDLDRQVINIRRKVALYHVLSLGLSDKIDFSKEMEEIIRLAKKYEQFPILCEQLRYKKLIKGFREGKKEFYAIDGELQFYKRCNNALEKATDCYHLTLMNTGFTSNADKKNYQSFLRDNIAELNEECAVLKSPLISYYSKNLEAMYYESAGNIGVTRSVFYQLLTIVLENKSVFRRDRVGTAYSQLAGCDLSLGRYEDSLKNAIWAQKYFIKNSYNYFVAMEHQFLASFYQADLNKSRALSSLLLKGGEKELGAFKYAKYLFYQANVLFAQRKFKEALHILTMKLEIGKDKVGWGFNVRVLSVQALVELNRMEDAARSVAGLVKQEALKPRDKTIFRIMQMLKRQGFDGARIRQKLQCEIAFLSHNKDCKWEPMLSELIPFDKWLASYYKISVKKSKLPLKDFKPSLIF